MASRIKGITVEIGGDVKSSHRKRFVRKPTCKKTADCLQYKRWKDVMLERKQYILLPFLFFNYESQMENASDPDVFQEINGLFDTIIQRLQELGEKNVISPYEASTLYDALKIVVESLGQRHKVEKEVQKIMGGTVLEFSADKYFNAGKEEGREEGREEGIEKGENKLASLISKLMELGRTDDVTKCATDEKYRDKLYAEFKIA